MKPRLSVIIPCWNVADWLPACLDSVLAAAPADAEVIAVNDGSPDACGAILADYSARDTRVRVISQANQGVSAARNHALDAARGDYVFFVDPDDTVEPDFFSALLAQLEADQADYAVCAFRGSPLKGDYRLPNPAALRNGYVRRIVGYANADVRAWYANTPLFAHREMASACRAVFRRDILERHHIRFDETIELYEDAMFNVEYLLHAQSMTCVNRPLYNVTNRPSGAMNRINGAAERVCRNKHRLLAKRKQLNALSGGSLESLYLASCAFSALEMLSYLVRGCLPRRTAYAHLRTYLADPTVRKSLREFPLSITKPHVAAVLFLLRLLTIA